MAMIEEIDDGGSGVEERGKKLGFGSRLGSCVIQVKKCKGNRAG